MIAIYMNSREWGGVDVLVSRFAEYLRSKNEPFALIQGKNSRLRQTIPWAPFLTIEEASQTADKADALFFPSLGKLRQQTIPWAYARESAPTFTWIIHPNDACFSFLPMAGRLIRRFGAGAVHPLRLAQFNHFCLVQSVLRSMIERQSLAVMDGATERSLEYYFRLKARPICVPIPSPVEAKPERLPPSIRDRLSVGYLGRLDAFKWSALRPFIEHDLAPYAERNAVSLIAVSEGPFADDLRSLCKRSNIALTLTGFLQNNEARSLLRQEVDLAVGMGTAALDLAAEGIPCLVIDPSLKMKAQAQKTYRFIHETDDFTLGEYRDFPTYSSTGQTFDVAVSRVKRDPDMARNAANYVASTHDPDAIFDALLCHIRQSKMTVGRLHSASDRINGSFAKVASVFGLRASKAV